MDFKKRPVIHGCKYIYTNHARERIIERYPRDCKGMNEDELNNFLDSLLSRSHENKSIFNDTLFITSIYEKYGPVRYKFMEVDDYLFITVAHEKLNNVYIVVTSYPRSSTSHKHFHKKRKY